MGKCELANPQDASRESLRVLVTRLAESMQHLLYTECRPSTSSNKFIRTEVFLFLYSQPWDFVDIKCKEDNYSEDFWDMFRQLVASLDKHQVNKVYGVQLARLLREKCSHFQVSLSSQGCSIAETFQVSLSSQG